MAGVLSNSSIIRNKHLQENLGLYKAYDGTINGSSYYSFNTKPLKRINEGSLYDYTHNELTDYSKNIGHLYFKNRTDFQPYINNDPINPQNFWGGEYHDYYDYVNAVYTQITPPIQFIEGLLSTQFLDEAIRVTSPAIVHNPEPTLSMAGAVKTNVNNFSGTDTRTGLLGNQMYANALYHGANFNTMRKESNIFINNSITPTVRQRFGNSNYTINSLSSIVSAIREDGRIVEDYNEGIQIYDDISNLSGDINTTKLFETLKHNKRFNSKNNTFINYTTEKISPLYQSGKLNDVTQHLVYSDNITTLDISDLSNQKDVEVIPEYETEFDEYDYIIDRNSDLSKNSLLFKTNNLFRQHKINNFGFGGFYDSKYENTTIDSTAIDGPEHGRGMRSRGRTLFKNKWTNENGYTNPFCRTWTYHHQYDTLDKLIRPLSDDDGNIMSIEQTQTLNQKRRAWNALFGETTTGEKYLSENTVLNNNGMVNIAPSKEGKVDIKKCMFSIENLAWKDVLNRDVYLSKEQRGPNGGRIMWFPPYDLNFSENTNVNWESSTFIGRGEKVYTYSNTDRTGTLSFTLLIDHPSTIYNVYTDGGDVREGLSDEDILRFFAGCSPIDIPENEKRIIQEPQQQMEEEPELVSKTTHIYVYFPNNYSGHYKTPISSSSEDTTVLPDDDFLDYMVYGVNADLRQPIACELCKGSGLCSNCNGEGQISCDCDNGFCKTCEGEGIIECETCSGLGNVLEEINGQKVSVKCSVCKGEGTIECPDCNGSGKCHKCEGTCKIPCYMCEQTENSEITEGPNKGKHKCGKCDGNGYIYAVGNKCTAEGCEGGFITHKVKHKCTVEGCKDGVITTTVACTYEGCQGGTIIKTCDKCNGEKVIKEKTTVEYTSDTEYYYSSSLLLNQYPLLMAEINEAIVIQPDGTWGSNDAPDQQPVNGKMIGYEITSLAILDGGEPNESNTRWGSISEYVCKKTDNNISIFFDKYITIKVNDEIKRFSDLYTVQDGKLVNAIPYGGIVKAEAKEIKLACFNTKTNKIEEVKLKLKVYQLNGGPFIEIRKLKVGPVNPLYIVKTKIEEDSDGNMVPVYNDKGAIETTTQKYTQTNTYLLECENGIYIMVNDTNFNELIKGITSSTKEVPQEQNMYSILDFNTLSVYNAGETITHTYIETIKCDCQSGTTIEECPECHGSGFTETFSSCTCEKGYTYENVYSACTVCNGTGIIPYKIIKPRGYEMSDKGLSIDQIDGETVTEGTFKCCKTKAKPYTECTDEGENIFYYRTDFDLKQNALAKTNYKDDSSFKLNSDNGNGDFTFAQLVYAIKRNEAGTFNAFLEYMMEILTDKDSFNKFKEKSEELYNILSNSSNISKITLNSSATKQDSGNSQMLARRRGATIKHLLEKTFPELKGKIVISYHKSNATGSSINSKEIKENRYSRIEIEYYTAKAEDMFDGNTQIKEEKDDISKRSITTDYDYTRYENEAQYFSKLKNDSPFLYNKIVDKFKYFTPAFHSVSAEGFNARLTFLQQCTRQGHTIEPKFTKNNLDSPVAIAGNLAFGRMPVCVLRIGDFIYSRVLITSMNINYGDNQWDLNPEGDGVQPMMAKVNLGITILGGQSLEGPISKLQNAVTFNYYANAGVYDDRADRGRPVGDSNRWSTDYYYTWEPEYSGDADE